MPAGPFHEIRDDQEVAREIHADDDVEFEVQPVLIDLLVGGQRVLGQAPLESFGGDGAQFIFRREAGFRHELRQDGLALFGAESAAARDLQCFGDGLGQIGELRPISAAS